MAKTMKATIELGGKVDKSLLNSMSKAERQMALLKKSAGTIGRVGAAAAKATAVAAAAAGAAVAKVVKDSIDAGKEFDASVSQIAATMGVSTAEVANLREFAIQMGESTKFSAKEAADALNYMALAGYTADQSMQALPNVLNLAAAGDIDLAAASDMVTDAQSALGLSFEQSAVMVDQMAKASSKTNTSVAQLGEAILTVGGTAKTLAGGTTELSTALGLLADNGVKGSEGGTALRNIILSLSAPTDKAALVLNKLGVEAFDANGNLRPLQDTFADLGGALGDLTQQEQTEALNNIFNKVDLKSVNALLGTNAGRWNEVTDAIADSAGAAKAMADTQLDNLAGDLTLLDSAFYTTKIRISDALTPALREFVQFGTEGLGDVNKILASDDFKEWAGSVAEDVTDAIRSAAQAVGEFKDGFEDGFDASSFLSALSDVGAAISSAFGDGSDAPAAKNFGSMLAGALNMTADAIRTATPLIQGVANVVRFLADNAGVAVPVMAGIAGAFVVMNAVSGVAGVLATVGTALGAIGLGGGAAGTGLTAMAGGEAAAGAAASASVGQLLAVGGAVLMIGGGVALAALGLGLMAQSAIALSKADGAPLVLLGIGVGLGVLMAVAAAVGPALDAAAVGLLAFGGSIALMGVGVLAACAGISLVVETLAANSASISEIVSTIGDVFNGAVSTIGDAISQIAGSVGGLAESIGGAISGVLDSIAGIFDSIGQAAINAGSGMQTMVDAIGRLIGMDLFAMGTSFATASDGIGKLVSSASGAADAAGSMEYLNGLVQSVSNRISELGEASAMLRSSTEGAAQAYALMVLSISSVSEGSAIARVALAALPDVTASGTAAFMAFAAGVSGAMRSAESAVSAACSSMQSKVSGLHLQIPTIKIAALPHLKLDGEFDIATKSVPSVRVDYYARGGFTGGPVAIAGEAGTEAVISFDRRYRDDNIGYWLMAGQMLGVMQPFAAGGIAYGAASPLSIDVASPNGSLATAAGSSQTSGGVTVDFGGVTFAPQISVSGSESGDVMAQLRAARDEFMDELEGWVEERMPDYGYVL